MEWLYRLVICGTDFWPSTVSEDSIKVQCTLFISYPLYEKTWLNLTVSRLYLDDFLNPGNGHTATEGSFKFGSNSLSIVTVVSRDTNFSN